jgi:hypothetical protein
MGSKRLTEEYNITEMARQIQKIKDSVSELKNVSGGIQAVVRNADRIQALVRMLEIEVSDAVDII